MLIKINPLFARKVISKGNEKFIKSHKTFGNFSVKKDLAYIEDGDPMHMLDVLSPVLNHENGIVLFYIHGGGYYYGRKEHNQIFNSWFVNQGFTVVSINYRLIDPKNNISIYDQVQDIFAALKYVSDNRHNLRLNMDKFCLLGDSAGGHLALLTDIIYRSKEAQEYYSLKSLPKVEIKCLGLNSTMYDFAKLFDFSGKYFSKRGKKYIFSNRCDEEGFLEKNSPRHYIKAGVRPSPIFNSTSYTDQLKDQSFYLKHDAEKYGLQFTHYFEPKHDKKLGHVFNHFNFEDEGKKCNDAMISFFKKYC